MRDDATDGSASAACAAPANGSTAASARSALHAMLDTVFLANSRIDAKRANTKHREETELQAVPF
jgi:hypothetical protein